jgi:thiosulfate dehydrogenase
MFKVILFLGLSFSFSVFADEFSQKDVEHWQKEYDSAAVYGRSLWDGSAKFKLGKNGVSCAQCHPNGANTHPETYPKFQKQLGKVAAIWEMINWCIRNPLEGKPLAADSKEMIALQAYVAKERKGVPLAPGKH